MRRSDRLVEREGGLRATEGERGRQKSGCGAGAMVGVRKPTPTRAGARQARPSEARDGESESGWAWDERSELPRFPPSRAASGDRACAGKHLDDLEYDYRNYSLRDSRSPSSRRTRLLRDEELRTSVVVVREMWKRALCEDILLCLRCEMEETGRAWHTKRHNAYSTVDLPLLELPRLDSRLRGALRRTLLSELAARYGFSSSSDLFFKDLFFVKYEAGDGGDGRHRQAGLDLHRDGSVLSFNVLLNQETEFQGGGTYFDHTKKTVEITQGDCVCHSGTVLHAGRTITSGTRLLLVGFVEASPSCIPYHLRNLFEAPEDQVSELEARATAERDRDGSAREGAQLDCEEDAMRLLCQ